MAYESVRSIPLRFAEAAGATVGSGRHRTTVAKVNLCTDLRIVGIKPTYHFRAFVDTGATFSVFGHGRWGRFADRIDWLSDFDDATLPAFLRSQIDTTGNRIPFRLGRVAIRFYFLPKPPLAIIESETIRVTAMFARPGGLRDDTLALIGLNGGVYDHVRLILEPGLESARFEQLL